MARHFIRTGKFPSWFILVAIVAGVIAAWRVMAQQPNILDAARSDTSPKRERGDITSLALRACDNSSGVQYCASAVGDSASGAAATLQYQGATSCAAAACHNGDAFKGTKGTEYATWMNQDKKHARAFEVLTEERSQIIVRNYRRGEAGKVGRAEEDRTCLSCHAMTFEPAATDRAYLNHEALTSQPHDPPRRPAATDRAYLNHEGVGCERCHGPAEKWLSIHFLPGWKEKSDTEKMHFGMTPTKNLVQRAKLCADCHIGIPDNDLNHDLYAAGHPPLYYEYSAFLGSMPRHWSEREEKARHPDFEIRVWALGQVVSAEVALKLLAHRAENKDGPWPEFAEYNCYACHHGLRSAKLPSPNAPRQQGTPGMLPWNSWFTPLLADALGGLKRTDDYDRLNQEMAKLKKRMEKPLPSRSEVAGQARALSQELARFLEQMESASYDAGYFQSLASALDKQTLLAGPTDWEHMTQLYLARQALYHARRDLGPAHDDAAGKRELENRRQRLIFPPGFSSPQDFGTK